MTELEEQEFFDNASTKPDNHYEALGLIPFSEFNLDNYNERKDYANKEISDSAIKNNALSIINKARSILTVAPKKKLYDTELRQSLKKRLVRLIKNAVKDDKKFSQDERDLIETNGKLYGFKDSEIRVIIEEQRKIYNFTDSSGTKEIETASKTTKAGSPKLEIHNNTKFTKNGEFIFDNVKLIETRREVITIKNGGGGTLDATAIYSAKWIEVIPKKIHQSKLPQDVTIVIDPSKDKSLKSGSAVKDTINLTYASSGATRKVPIVVKMAIEGHHNLVKRQSKYATIISSIIAGLMLLYIFSNYDFSGWAIFGFVVSAIAIGIGAFAVIEDENNIGILIIGGIILLITNWTVFALLSTIIITFYAAKFIFEKNPFRNELIAAIPVGSFAIFLLLFFGASNLRYSNYDYQRNYNNSNTHQNTYQPTRSINKYAYIKANPIGNIRSGTSTDYSILTSLNYADKVYVIEQDKATNWYKVKYGNNNYGYASHKIIDFNYVAPKSSENNNSTKKSNTNSNLTITSSKSILDSKKIRNHPNTFRGVVGILNYGVQVDNDLNNLFRKEFNVSVSNNNLERLGFQQLNKSSKFRYKYVSKPLTQKEIYEHLNIQKSISYLKGTATQKQLQTYNNSNNSNNTTKKNKTKSLSSILVGNWRVLNEKSSYLFSSNGIGNYTNSRGKTFSFNWSTNSNYLKIELNSDNSIWNWKINSKSPNKITMFSSQHNINRTIIK